MTFKFECAACGQRIAATKADVGTIGVCPACGIEFAVPRPEPVQGLSANTNGKREKRGGLALPFMALVLCNAPWLVLFVLKHITFHISPTWFVVLMSAPCLTGLISGHLARQRSVGQRASRVISTLSLVIGYMSLFGVVVVTGALATGTIVLYRQVTDTPDFTAVDSMPFTPPQPTAEPTPQRKTPPFGKE